jgi:hypothetical protein
MKSRYEILADELYRETQKGFKYLPDHPEDWRFRNYKIDYYSVIPERDILIGVKVLPAS